MVGPTLKISEGTKRCWCCKLDSQLQDFHKGSDRCKSCARAYAKRYREANKEKASESSKKAYLKNKEKHLKRVEERRLERQYGLTTETYTSMFIEHDYKCAICGTPNGPKFSKLVVDHCHTTGAVRGLLCRTCNAALGGFKDDITTLAKAIKYLEDANER